MAFFTRIGAAVFVSALTVIPFASAAEPCNDLLDSVEPCGCGGSQFSCRLVSSDLDLLAIPGLQNGQSLNFTWITIVGCQTIKQIPAGAFGNHNAEIYYFSKNTELREISAGAFATTGRKNVRRIEVTESPLTSFPFHAIQAYPNLKSLQLVLTGLRELPPHALNDTSQSLTFVSLTGNRMTSIGSEAFMNLPALRDLHLQENQLTTLTAGSLRFGHRLDLLFLHYNSIADIEPGFTDILPAHIYLSHNQIQTMEQATWENLLNGYLVDNVDAKLDLSDNPMMCDCHMKWLYDRKDFEHFIGISIQCHNFGGTPLWSLENSAFDGC